MVDCSLPCRSQMPSVAWFLGASRQAAKTPPEGAAAGKLPPGATSRMGVAGVLETLISQMSVVALGAAGAAGVAVAEGPLDAPGPGWPAGRVTSNRPARGQLALKTVPESANRLSGAHPHPRPLN